MRLVALVLSGVFAVLAPIGAARAQEDPRLDELEEQVLRAQVEVYVNEFARWDAEQKRIVIERREASKGGGRLAICGMTKDVRMVFELTRLNKFFEIYDDEAAARSRFT